MVGTWNGDWFPSGRAEHRAHPDVERATITAAAKMLAKGIGSVDPLGTNDVIICLNEIRDPKVASNLVSQIGRANMKLAVISRYRRRDRFDYQQDVIATTLPVVESHWSKWKNAGKSTPPRGYAFASVVISPAVTANVYAVHLKSNYGAKSDEAAAENRAKRTLAISQIVDQETSKRTRLNRPVIIAGDMNTDRWRKEFANEEIFGILSEAGFSNLIGFLPIDSRWTYPNRRYGNSALDYIFVRGFDCVGEPKTIDSDALSDHRAVFSVVQPK